MFVRIYTGILASICIAAPIGYGVYEVSNRQRLTTYQSDVFSGSMQLVADTAARQASQERKLAYLDNVARLMGAEIKLDPNTASLDADERVQLGSGLPVAVNRSGGITDWWVPTGIGRRYAILTFRELTEQKYRGLAGLLAVEQARLGWPDTADSVEQYSSSPVRLYGIEQMALDAQQLSRLRRGSVVAVHDEAANTISVYAPAQSGKVLGVGPIPQFNALPWTLFMTLLGIFITVVVIVTTVMVFLSQRQFQAIVTTLDRYGSGDLDARVNMSGNDAFARLSDRFDAMATQIQSLLDDRQNLLQAVSHELRTPLARMKFRLQFLEGVQVSEEERAKIDALGRDIAQLEALVSELMTYHRLSDKQDNQTTTTELGSLLAEEISNFVELNPELTFTTEVDEDISLFANKEDVCRVISNLFTNAVKHANNEILITLTEIAGEPTLIVADDGPGIPEPELERVFDAFYRIDSSRNKSTGGYGLGLAIVRRLCLSMGAEVSATKSERLGGAMVKVVFKQVNQC